MSGAFLAGFQLSLGLIMAIGAQNAFVLRQGILREHVLAVCLFCGASDALLISAGVAGMGGLSEVAPWIVPVLRWGGAGFLIVYGARAFRAAYLGGAGPEAAPDGGRGLLPVIGTLALITWTNPHVYIDTVVLIGSVSAQYPGQAIGFATGASLASVSFFLTLGYGARVLVPVFARPGAWRVLDLLVGLLMWGIAAGLLWT